MGIFWTGILGVIVALIVGYFPKWIGLFIYLFERDSKKLAQLEALDNHPDYMLCGRESPDNQFICRLDVGHGGWHTEDGTKCWYNMQWKDED